MKQLFHLTSDYIALCDLLKCCGLADTGGKAKYLIAQGEVSVDGQVEWRKTCKIRCGQCVSIGDVMIEVSHV